MSLKARIVLGFSLCLRIILAFFREGFDHPNEIYRVIEPLMHIYFRESTAQFEYEINLMSYLGNYLDAFLIYPLYHFKVPTIFYLKYFRLLFALLSLIPLYYIYVEVKKRTTENWGLVALFFSGFFLPFAYYQVHLFGTIKESIVLSLVLLLDNKEKKSHYFLMGLLLSFCFFIRYQSILYSFVFLIFNLKNPKKVAYATLGFLVMLAFSIYVDSLENLTILEAPWNYFKFNILDDKAASEFGADPIYRYFFDYLKFFNPLIFLFLLYSLKFYKKFLLPFILVSTFVITHSLISHKEFRFLFSTIPILMMIFFVGLYQHKKNKPLVFILILSFIFTNTEKYIKMDISTFSWSCNSVYSLKKTIIKKDVKSLSINYPLGGFCGSFILRPEIRNISFNDPRAEYFLEPDKKTDKMLLIKNNKLDQPSF